MIQEVDIIQLDPRLIKQLEGADRAESSDVGYTMEIYSSILKQYPGCLELRKNFVIYNSNKRQMAVRVGWNARKGYYGTVPQENQRTTLTHKLL